MKECNVCHVEKPLEAFYRNRRAKDGRQGYCKACDAERSARRTREDPNYKAQCNARSKKWHREKGNLASDPSYHAERARYYNERSGPDPQEDAHRAVEHGKNAGILEDLALMECDDCDDYRSSADDYHHESYAPGKRLDVIPLCRSCHVKRHESAGQSTDHLRFKTGSEE